ncbi:MAG: hypothetical protein ACJZ85_03620 [Pontiellaceae bacterium]
MQFFKKIVIGWVLFFTVCAVAHADTVSKLEETGRAFKSIAKEALPAVVFIDVESTVEVPASHFEHPFFEQFFWSGLAGRLATAGV